EDAFPLKCCYIGNTFSFDELGGGRQNEFTQAGCEILGLNSPEADAEVVAMAAEAIRLSGIEEFQIEIGQVNFFKGIMEETGLSDEEIEEVRELIDLKDFVGVEQVMDRHQVKDSLKRLILDLPKLFGSKDILQRLNGLEIGERAAGAIQNLKAILDILEDRNLSQYVSIDLGMVQSLTYYTGIVFRGYTYGVGFPILSGGRYDKLVSKFGKECEATGFSLGINMVLMALERQKKLEEPRDGGCLVTYAEGARKAASDLCKAFISQGLAAELDITQKSLEDMKGYAISKGYTKVIRVLNDGTGEEIAL
ncbi:MAG: ATP phosphoribosyltransferase regulatory subunit, partial [Clostridia bacterium]|nr:ATP phosphoribosyltransferase regulatory subunit [Clostridia bacterium]